MLRCCIALLQAGCQLQRKQRSGNVDTSCQGSSIVPRRSCKLLPGGALRENCSMLASDLQVLRSTRVGTGARNVIPRKMQRREEFRQLFVDATLVEKATESVISARCSGKSTISASLLVGLVAALAGAASVLSRRWMGPNRLLFGCKQRSEGGRRGLEGPGIGGRLLRRSCRQMYVVDRFGSDGCAHRR